MVFGEGRYQIVSNDWLIETILQPILKVRVELNKQHLFTKFDSSKIYSLISLLLIGFFSCKKESPIVSESLTFSNVDSTIIAMDVSSLSMILRKGIEFKDLNGKSVNIFNFLRNQGINTIRLRTWVGNNINYNKDSILKISRMARSQGLLIWLDLHYSNTWADPETRNPH